MDLSKHRKWEEDSRDRERRQCVECRRRVNAHPPTAENNTINSFISQGVRYLLLTHLASSSLPEKSSDRCELVSGPIQTVRFGQPRPAAERIGREGKPLAGDRPKTSANGGDILCKYRAGWSPIPQQTIEALVLVIFHQLCVSIPSDNSSSTSCSLAQSPESVATLLSVTPVRSSARLYPDDRRVGG